MERKRENLYIEYYRECGFAYNRRFDLGGQYAANYCFRETDKFTPTLPEYFSDGTPNPANKNMRNSVSQAHQDALTQTLQLTLNFQKQNK